MPPKVSYQHPADLRPEPTRRKASRTVIPPPPPPPMMPVPNTMTMPVPSINPPTHSNGGSGLSFAQRLYASSNSTDQTPPFITATARDFANTSTPHPPPIHTSSLSSLPTPPLSTSPSPGFNLPRTLPTIPQESHDSVGIDSTTDFYNNNLGFGNSANSRSAHSRNRSNTGWNTPSHGSASSNFSSPHIHGSSEGSLGHPPFHPPLHRTQSYQIPPPPPLSGDLHHPHRASTFAASSSARPSSSSGPRILTTTARPPPNATNISDSTPNLQTVASPPPPTMPSPMPGVVNPGMSGLPSPPYAGSLSPPIGSPPPPPFFPGMPATNAQPAIQPQSKPPTSPPISPAQAAQNEERNKILKQIGLAVGKTAGKAALKVTGHALMSAAGIQPGSMEGKLFTGMGNSILNSDAIGALVNNLAGTNSGVNASNLQAAAQGQPGADYQGIINALMQQQQQQQASTLQIQQSQPGPAANYQALINELQKLQANASSQQQAPVQPQNTAQQQQALFQAQLQQTQALLNGASNPSQQHQNQYQNQHHHNQHHHNQHQNSATSQLNALQQQLQALNQQSQQDPLQALLQQQQSNSNQFDPSSLFTQNNTDFSGLSGGSGFSDFSGGGSSDYGLSDATAYANALAEGFAAQEAAIF